MNLLYKSLLNYNNSQSHFNKIAEIIMKNHKRLNY